MSQKRYRWDATPGEECWREIHSGDRYEMPPVFYARIGVTPTQPDVPEWSNIFLVAMAGPEKVTFTNPVTLKEEFWDRRRVIHKPKPYEWMEVLLSEDALSWLARSIAGHYYDGPIRSMRVVNAAEDLSKELFDLRKRQEESQFERHGPVLREDTPA